MNAGTHRKQVLLFFAAVLLPSLVLVVLTLRLASQQEELAQKREAEDRQNALREIRERLLSKLEVIKSRGLDELAAQQPAKWSLMPGDDSIVLIAPFDGSRLAPPWDAQTSLTTFQTADDGPRFRRQLQEGAHAELAEGNPARAVPLYRQAAQSAPLPVQSAQARILLARALYKSGRRGEALSVERQTALLPLSLRDDQGIPFALYAATEVVKSASLDPAGLGAIRSEVESRRWLPPAEAYLLLELSGALVKGAKDSSTRTLMEGLQREAARRVDLTERVLALRDNLPDLVPLVQGEHSRSTIDPRWMPFGPEPWLVSIAAPVKGLSRTLVAVHGRSLFRSVQEDRASLLSRSFRVKFGTGNQGEMLGAAFPGLRAQLTPVGDSGPDQRGKLESSLYIFTLILVLSVTFFGAYLVWRDVRRELRLAALRSQFVSSVSHELRTPLAAIRMFAETLRMGRTSGPETQAEYLDTIVNESERLTRLLDNILDFSKIERGERNYKRETVSLAQVVRAAARTLHYPLSNQGFKLQVEIDSSLPPVSADIDAIEQAVLNLLTDAMSRVTSFGYDSMGRVTSTTFPSTVSETYAYDAVGNLLTKTDRKGQAITYAYDNLDRLASKTVPGSGVVSYTYDSGSRLTQVADSTGTYSFTYDNMGRLTGTTTYSFLSGRTLTESYGYDAASNRTGFTDPEGGVNSYGYDSDNRLTSLASATSGSFSFSYDSLSRRTQLSRPNGINANYAYDSLSRLLSVLDQKHNATLDGAAYTYDPAGNRLSRQDYRTGTMSNFAYDAVYQLQQVTQSGQPTETYSYDDVGNRLSSLGGSPYSYDNSNERNSQPGVTYSYDANGNLISKTDATGTTTYVWDVENRLTSVTLPAGGGTVTYQYDPFGRRIEKISPTGTTIYAYDGDNVVEELDGSGTAMARYAQGLGIDEPLAMYRGGASYYYNADGLGSITSLTDASGQIAASYTYDSFGKLTASTGTVANPFRYTGREYGSDTGLYYYRARYYDSSVGRFISEDPLQFNGGDVNHYPYVENAPTFWIDPYGEVRCARGVNCDYNRDLADRLDCFERCSGHEVTVTCGTGGHAPTDPHTQGEAVDIGRNTNPWLSRGTAETCYSRCFPANSYAQEEWNRPDHEHGTHFHFQNRQGRHGGHGFAAGVQEHTPQPQPRR
jgi:RHS repeat-associated protein